MSSHAAKVKDAICEFESAVASGDKEAAYAAFLEMQVSAEAVRKAKCSPHPKTATATSTAADADVVAACDSATAALATANATPQPATPAGPAPAVAGIWDDLWSLFVTNAPAILSWIKKLFSSGTVPNPVP